MIPLFKPYISPYWEIFTNLAQVFDSGYVAEGNSVEEFEIEFLKFLDHPSRRVVAVNSCTSALHIALLLSGAGPATEVISTPMTAEPTNLAIKYTGAHIVWADVNPFNGNIDWEDAESKITNRTVAIMCVHYGGIPCFPDSGRVPDIPDHVSIIEDAAHALGAKWVGRHVGGWSDAAAFSFQAIKHMTTGDGGVLVVHQDDLAAARQLRWFGIERDQPRDKMDIKRAGYKYNMNNITAAIGLVQLRYIQRHVINKHIANGWYFDTELANVPGIMRCEHSDYAAPSYWFYTIFAETRQDRDDLSKKLTEAGIANSLIHRRNDRHSVFAESRCELPGLDWFWNHALHIPCGWWLTEEDRIHIVDTIKAG